VSDEKHWVDDNHYRTVSEDGKTSFLFKADGGILSTDTCTEVTSHHGDGTTDAYVPDNSAWDGRGDHK
jgi:hypothetical protein